MKKQMFKLVIVSAMIAIFSSAAMAADVVLTPFGQSPDAMMVRVVLKKLKVDSSLEKLLQSGDLKGEKVLITVVGGSSKGLGAAGIDKDSEVSRVQALVKDAKDKGTKVLVMHIGGKGRRGKLSDMFISESVPMADKVIVVDGGDHDGLFTNLLDGKNVEMLPAKSVRGTGEPLKKVLTEWGVI